MKLGLNMDQEWKAGPGEEVSCEGRRVDLRDISKADTKGCGDQWVQ